MSRRPRFVKIVLRGEITEAPLSFQLFSRRETLPFSSVLNSLLAAEQKTKVRAVLIIVKKVHTTWSQIEEIHRFFKVLKKTDKRIIVYLESADNKTYYLAAAADVVLLPPSGTLELVGLRSEIFYFKNLLSFLGVEPQLFNIGDYKSAAEIFQRDHMSKASREMTDSILSDIQGRLLRVIADHRQASPERAREWIDNGPYTARRALSEGLVDGLAYEDELPSMLERMFPRIRRQPVRLREGFVRRILTFYRPQIALILAEGVINTGQSRRTSGRWPQLGASTLISFLQAARRRRRVKAIVLRINSPGGSGLASDLIWREVALTNQAKPVIISFADVAASGGYYIATGGCRILANEATLTGSIGVIAGKFNLQKLLDRIGITSDSVDKGARSGWASPTRPFASDEAAAIREQMRDFYEDLFLPKVAASREQSIGNVRKLAEGRVWTGSQAVENGLVDSVGGIREAVQLARKKAGLQEQRHRIVRYTTSRSLLDILPGRAVPSLSIDRVLALMPEDLNVS